MIIVVGCLLHLNLATLRAQESDDANRPNANANANVNVSPNEDEESSLPWEIGIRGFYRPGQWTGVRLTKLDADKANLVSALQTLDGDGVRVVYTQPDASRASDWRYAVPGTRQAPLQLLSSAGEVVLAGTWGKQGLDPKTPWIITIGDSLGIETLGRNELLNREATVATSLIDDAGQLPDQSAAYAGVDLLVITPSGADILQSLREAQRSAMEGWLAGGGRVLMSLGEDGQRLADAAPWLWKRLALPEKLDQTRIDPSAIETYTSSQVRLPTLAGVALPERLGVARIMGRNSSRQPSPIAMDIKAGFGRATVVAVSLESPELAQWPQRSTLVTRLAGGVLASEFESRRDQRIKSTSVAYDDLAGQIRAALDLFELRRRVPYSIISLVLVGLVALIGPIDYLLVNRWLGRPLLGWLTFPLSVILVSGLLIFLGRPSSAATDSGGEGDDTASASGRVAELDMKPHMNRIEIIDIHAAGTQLMGRGWSWAQVSANSAVRLDYPASIARALVADDTQPTLLSMPFGYSSATFGGISIAGDERRLPSYEIPLAMGDNGRLTSQITGVPLPPGGSKGIVSCWQFQPKLEDRSDLTRRRGSDLLEGRLENPLDVDIINGALVFGEWVYLLPTRFQAGQSIANVDTLRQKNFRWLLARREALENSSRAEPWNAEMDDDFQRLSEMLMFETVAGGRDYTGLHNRPLGELDLSYLLDRDTAILYGRLERAGLEIDLPENRVDLSAIRLVLPVGLPKLRRTE